MTNLPTYDRAQTYEWNYEHAPELVDLDIPQLEDGWQFAGLPVDSPLGVPAGPLLNGRWCLYYASLGFDVLTYKTVRSVEHKCYPLPNLQPVCSGQLHGDEEQLPVSDEMQGSWAVSFGMPSKSPDVWRDDVRWTRENLPKGKLLSVSVVGTVQDGWSIEDLARDYAQCARWAVESGADCIETNFSCPNVSTCDGQLYQNPTEAAVVAQVVRDAIGNVPYLVKVGHVESADQAEALLEAVSPHVSGLAMTNSVAVTVKDASGELLFDGQRRGICGAAILDASLKQVQMFAAHICRRQLDLRLVGVGGSATAKDVVRYLDSGADAVHIATAAMTNPLLALEIKKHLAASTRAAPI